MPWNAVDPMGLDGHFMGDVWRSIGLNWMGEFSDDVDDGAIEVWERVTGDPYAEHAKWQMQMANMASANSARAARAGNDRLAQSIGMSLSLEMHNAEMNEEFLTDGSFAAVDLMTSLLPTGWAGGRIAGMLGNTARGKAINLFGEKIFRIVGYVTDPIKKGLFKLGNYVTGKLKKLFTDITRVAGRGSKPPISAEPEGIIYERLDPITGERYVGQSESPERFLERQNEHHRLLGTRHDYTILERGEPGFQLDMLEEDWIRRMGGPKRKGGTLANKRYQVNDRDYCANGGSVPKPTK
jgi:hypothetical protein